MSSAASSSMSGMSHMTMTTSIASAAAATASASSQSDHGGMDMGGKSCKISMLWNWYTIDACFLSESWHITSHGAFAATCIGVAGIVVLLEFFRRLGKEYDAYLIRQYQRSLASKPRTVGSFTDESAFATFRATPLQQLIRAVMHAIVFGLAYIVMLLAMYYNGYVIFSIILGAGIGKFLCDWMVVKIPLVGTNRDDAGKNIDHQIDEPSVCCG